MAASESWPEGDEAISHLIALSMDAWGEPIGLFACNRWVTGETWYAAEDVVRMLNRFEIDHAWPSWPVNRWLGAMLRLYRPWIEGLLRHRDAVVSVWQRTHRDGRVRGSCARDHRLSAGFGAGADDSAAAQPRWRAA